MCCPFTADESIAETQSLDVGWTAEVRRTATKKVAIVVRYLSMLG